MFDACKGCYIEDVLEYVEDVIVVLVVLVKVCGKVLCPVEKTCNVFKGIEIVVDEFDCIFGLGGGDREVGVQLLYEGGCEVREHLKDEGLGSWVDWVVDPEVRVHVMCSWWLMGGGGLFALVGEDQ